MTKRIISIISLVLILAVCLVSTTSCLLVYEGLKELENQTQGGETPDGPGEGGETPEGPGEGGETPDGPGEGGETPDGPGEGGEEPPHEHNFVDGKCECGEDDPNYVPPHVNKLVVGETNEIYVDGSVVNAWSQPIVWVEFVVTEKANYKFVCAETGALALIYASDYTTNLCGYTGAADLEAGTYYVCVGGGAIGMFNVTVTKTAIEEQPGEGGEGGEVTPPAHVNSLTVGDTNKIVVSGDVQNAAGLPIEWVSFTADEKAHYEFIGDTGVACLIFDTNYALLCAGTGKADLEAGTYLICVGNGAVGEFNVAVTKSAIEEPVNDPFVFEAQDLEAAAAGSFTDGQKVLVGTNDYFTLIMSAKTKIDSSNKTWSDEYTSGQRLNFGGATAWGTSQATVTKQGIMFTTSDAATIKVWWVCGGDGDRYVAIWDSTGKVVSATTVAANGDIRLDTLGVPAAGVYYLSNPVNNNYIFKVEVTEGEAPAHEHVWSKATCTEAQKCYCGETQGEAPGHTEVTDAAVDPTCTEAGKTEGKHCSVCNEVLVKQDAVEASGHNYVDNTCSVCGAAKESEGGETPEVPAVTSQVHDFTENGKTSTFYTITGNLSTSKGTVDYDGKTLNQCLKMESSTSIKFTASSDGTLRLVFLEAGKKVKFNGTSYTTDANGIVEITVAAGENSVTKGDSINLFYMVYTPNA